MTKGISLVVLALSVSSCSDGAEVCDIPKIVSENSGTTCNFKGYVSNIDYGFEFSHSEPKGVLKRGAYIVAHESTELENEIHSMTSDGGMISACLLIAKVRGFVQVVDIKRGRC